MNFKIDIVSVPDREDLVAEVWWGDTLVAELHRVNGRFVMDIYPCTSGDPWSFDLQSWLKALEEAQRKLG